MKRLRLWKDDPNGITEGVIWKQLLLFFFPIMLGTFFQQLYNTIDAVIVGQFVGKEALASVGGPTAVIINLLVGFFVGLASGATVIISQYYGAQRSEDVSRATHTAMALAISGGALLTVIGIAIAPWSLRVIDTPEDMLADSVLYMRIYFAGTIPSLIYNIGSGILRAVGDSRRPLYFLVIGCLTNILLDLLFVVVFRMGVSGAAIATILSQTVCAALVVAALMRTSDCYRLILRKIRFSWDIFLEIIKIGIPSGLQSVLYSFSNIIIQSSVNAFGTDTVAAWTAYGKIDALFWMTINAFGISITTFVGQNFGARKYDRIHKSVRICTAMAMGSTAALSVFFCLLGEPIYHIFTQDSEVIRQGVVILRTLAPLWFTFVCIEVLSGAVRGTGDALIPTIMTCFGVCVLRVIWIYAAVPHWNSIVAVVLCYPITWSVTSVLYIIYYLSGGWLRRRRAAAGDPVRPEELRPKRRARS